ncbi:unnamed protein product [Zymoseptoria tritici ST99CH_3D1]|nr:unnamed protein product [Zymoseptoria tritici ST99CH_3D1]
MELPKIDPYLTESDQILLKDLYQDIKQTNASSQDITSKSNPETTTTSAITHLKALNDPTSPSFSPTIFVSWDTTSLPLILQTHLIHPYARFATTIVRHPTDIVFLTHILLYLTILLPSALYLFHAFTYLHATAHLIFTVWCAGGYTLMLHNHIHNNGVLAPAYKWLDFSFPYVLSPLLGHTWDSYYYHHVKHHHVEGNGPDDLSSTLRYQRDEVWDFAQYVGRFLFFVWLDLPLYFLRKGKYNLAVRSFGSEMASFGFMAGVAAYFDTRAAIFTLILPFVVLRLGLMVGNWGQHALVDEVEPDSDYRSSITLIDVASNRFSFNDGYHTAHHLNPLRHWREQPLHFLSSKSTYASNHALVFSNIDYIFLTLTLLRKDYDKLARCLVPIGEEQIAWSHEERVQVLRRKTRRFGEEEIGRKFPGRKSGRKAKGKRVGFGGWIGKLEAWAKKMGALRVGEGEGKGE